MPDGHRYLVSINKIFLLFAQGLGRLGQQSNASSEAKVILIEIMNGRTLTRSPLTVLGDPPAYA